MPNQTVSLPVAEPNLTPMIDVLLVLIIVFMVMVAQVYHTMDVQLPDVCVGNCVGSDPIVLEVMHRTPGNLRGFVQAKMRNLRSGSMIEHRFSSEDKVEKAILEFLQTAWEKPDEGIWEVRGGRKHFLHSRLMCWVAFDRAIRLGVLAVDVDLAALAGALRLGARS